MKFKFTVLLLAVAVSASPLVSAHTVPDSPPLISVAEMQQTVGWDFSTPVTTEVLDEGLYVLFGMGGNVLVSSGEDGVVIVDDQFPGMWPALAKAMRKQGDKKIDFVINSHWHFDHADGNQYLGKSKDTWIVSQANSRKMLLSDQTVNLVLATIAQPAYPAHALPDITFDKTMQLHLNGERIDLLHAGPAHTTGDAAVIFRGRNAVHMGDVYNNQSYPFIDAGNGGGIDGVIAFCQAVLGQINADTKIVPGHGPVAAFSDLDEYIGMLIEVRNKLRDLIHAGKSLEEIQAMGITKKWDEKRGDPTGFIDRSYTSLTTRHLEK